MRKQSAFDTTSPSSVSLFGFGSVKFDSDDDQVVFVSTVPPGAPFVVDRSIGTLNSSVLGPKEEGDDLLLTCTVQGGEFSNVLYENF